MAIKKKVAWHHNCLNKPLITCELDRVAPPYLHLLLGLVLRHHRLLEAAAAAVDAMLAQQSEDDAYGEGESVRKFGSNWKQAEQLKKQEMDLYGMLVLEGDGAHLMEEDEKIQCIEDLKDAQDALDDLERGDKLGEREGPVCSKFDNILSKNKITPQAYHSRSFVGNHCHKYLTKKVFKELTASAVETTYACTKNIMIQEEAERMQRKFNMLNEAFAFVHESISHCQPIKSEDISTIRGQILNYTSMFRKFFPGKVFPKLHILEHHCIEWIEKYEFGLAAHGEQAGEAVHASVALLERRGRGIRDKQTQMRIIVSSQHLQASPVLHQCVPPIKKRKLY